jgi:hypothetical protein
MAFSPLPKHYLGDPRLNGRIILKLIFIYRIESVGWNRVIQDGIQLQSVETKNISRLVKGGEI